MATDGNPGCPTCVNAAVQFQNLNIILATVMVRVISLHHFSSQNIDVCCEPVAVTTAPPDLLLVALANHTVQVRNLANGGQTAFTFPTVDKVKRIVHCAKGNYVATLETKLCREGKVSVYARIYVNWDAPSSWQENMVVRARIAGRVTPSSQQCSQGGLEMIELPIKGSPSTIGCSQLNGSIVLPCFDTLMMFHYKVKSHDISHQKFIDFDTLHLGLQLCFSPTHIEICEDVIACMDSQHVHMFKIVWENAIIAATVRNTLSKARKDVAPSETKLSSVAKEMPKDYIDWDGVLNSKGLAPELSRKVNLNSFPIIVDLPSIANENLSESTSILQQSPFITAALDMNVNVQCSTPGVLCSDGIRITNLLQLKINPVTIGCESKHVVEEFKSVVLKPFYVRNPVIMDKTNCDDDALLTNPFLSPSFSSLASIICVAATQQEGFLYYFPMSVGASKNSTWEHYDLKKQQDACMTIYPFTAPVSALVMEDNVLHALTEIGLETYTTKSGHFLTCGLEAIDNSINACPAASDPVCLVGLRPFLGVEHLVLSSSSHLVLLAASEDSDGECWTIYSLGLPTASSLYTDIMAVGKSHRWSSPSTYCHLLSEGHVILRTATYLTEGSDDLTELYKESCALLADFYLSGETEESWSLACPYYRMSGLSPLNVISRLNKLKEDFARNNEQFVFMPGLLHYLKTCLLQMNNAADELLFTPAVPTFVNVLLDLFDANAPDQISELVLCSKVIREFACDRVLATIKAHIQTKPLPEPTDALALVLLCIQKNFPSQATALVESMCEEALVTLLFANFTLLLENDKDKRRDQQCLVFTELATILVNTRPAALAQVLFKLVISGTEMFSLHHILQALIELMARVGNSGFSASPVLQLFLELYFSWFFERNQTSEYDVTTTEALKMLVRSYLSDLQRPHFLSMQNSSSLLSPRNGSAPPKPEDAEPAVLFIETRPKFLDKIDLFSKHSSPTQLSPSHEPKSPVEIRNSTTLLKLQALLSSGRLPPECIFETHQYVKSHPRTHGHLSLLVLCLPSQAAADVILNFCPEAILQFCQDKFETDADWQWIILKIQQKIRSMEEDNILKGNCIQVFTDLLTHLSQTLSLESLITMLPPGEASIQSYIRTCQEMSHASHIRSILSTTGHQLLNSLNL